MGPFASNRNKKKKNNNKTAQLHMKIFELQIVILYKLYVTQETSAGAVTYRKGTKRTL